MTRYPRSCRAAVAGAAILLALSACTDGAAEPTPEMTTPPGSAGVAGETAASELASVGVTQEPCPEPVDPEHGCIYLGVLSDLTEGPFSVLGVSVTEGQRAFWRRVNEEGGIGGYEVDIDTFTRDTGYDPAEHRERYLEIEPNVLALAQTFGTPTTREIVEEMDADDVVGVPASWWSGWGFEEVDANLALESGYSYCLEPMIALDWLTVEREQPASVLVVGFDTAYGRDVAAGARTWTQENDAEFVGFVETSPNAERGSQREAIDEIVSADPDVVLLAVGPTETGEIVGGAEARGYVGQFVGSAPTWNPVLMETPAADALRALFLHVGPWNHFEGETAAHEAMRQALGNELPSNDGFTYGWVWSYPLEAALRAAVEAGDLSRDGLRDAVTRMEVDYEDALPATAREGGRVDVSRSAVISAPSPDAPLGLATLQTGATGPTADAYEYTAPCSSP